MARNIRNVILAAVAAVASLCTSSRATAADLTLNITADDYYSVYLSNDDAVLGTLQLAGPVLSGPAGGVVVHPHYTPDGVQMQGVNASWTAVTQYNISFDATKNTFLHIVAENDVTQSDSNTGNPAGLLAQLTMVQSNVKFPGGNGQLLTNSADWRARTSSYDGQLIQPPSPITDGSWWVAPEDPAKLAQGGNSYNDGSSKLGSWSQIPHISSAAQWIWTADFTQDPGGRPNGGLNFFSARISYASVPEATTMVFGLAAVMPLLSQRRRQRAAATPAA